MIVPTSRTLWLFAVTMLPAALVLAMAAESRLLVAGVCLFLGAVAAGDALLAERRRRGLGVEFPERLTMSCDQELALPFAVFDAGGARRSLVIALRLPDPFTSPRPVHAITLRAGPEPDRVQWPLTGTRRGNYQLGPCLLRLLSPLGLWQAQGSLPTGTLLKVYPNLREERKRLAALFLNHNSAQVTPKRQVGQGREFEKLRLYLPGDALADVHWRATAKRGQLVTKEFQIERTQEVYLIVDASRLSSRVVPCGGEGGGEPLLEQYLRSALMLGSVTQKQGDLFGVMAFSDRVLGFVRAQSGKEHYGVCRDALYALEPGKGNPGYDEAASFLAAKLKRRSLLVFLTSLEEPALAEDFLRSIRVLSRRHVVCVAMQRPAAAAPLFSQEAAGELDDLYRALGGHLVWHALRELQQTLRLRGVQLSLVEDQRLTAELVSKYLDVKRRQML